MEKIESAIQHTFDEVGFHHIASSLKAEFEIIQKAHDSVHEFILLAPLCFPKDAPNEVSWQNKSAFLLYQWEAFDQAHRSLIEALSAHYNVAFILLRTTLELLLKGALWECLSRGEFRDNSFALDSKGKVLNNRLLALIKESSNVKEELDQNSSVIFDKLSDVIGDSRLPIKAIIGQLEQWGIFNSISNATNIVYKIYSDLSGDVHVVPNKMDIGRRIISDNPEIFERHIDPAVLQEYMITLHEVMDLAIVIELNILHVFIERFESVQSQLSKRLTVLEQLELQYSPVRLRELLTRNNLPAESFQNSV